MYNAALKYIKETFQINTKNIKAYFHYFPTNYALHIHFIYDKGNKEYTCNNHDFFKVVNYLKSDSWYYTNNTVDVLIGDKPVLMKS